MNLIIRDMSDEEKIEAAKNFKDLGTAAFK